MIVRELIAVLGIELDDRDVKKVDTAVSKFEGRIQKTAQFIGGAVFLAGFARAAGAVIQFASDAEETLNLVRETFGDNASDVEAWSVRVAKEVGRSEFLMRELAGTLGSVLTPLMQGNTQASADMSTGLATLAVDLASFFNAAESDVLVALRSGIVGEAEPLKRFGIVMLESTLQAFALAEGITKSVKSMSIAEKTTLRYRFILSQTVSAQGDAARTADAFANASRAASDGIKDLATRIGNRLLPVATRFMIWTRDAARGMVEVAQKTNLVEGVLFTLAAALGVAAVMMLLPFLPFLITAAKVLAVLALMSIAADELITFFKGGKTVIGEFIDELFGIGAAQTLLDNLNAGWSEMHGWWTSLINLGKKFKQILFGAPQAAGPGVNAGLQGDAIGTGGTRRAIGPGVRSAVVTSRRGSTGRNLRLARARQLDEKRRGGKKLTRLEKLELSRITDQVDPLTRETPAERRRREAEVALRGASVSSARRTDASRRGSVTRARDRLQESAARGRQRLLEAKLGGRDNFVSLDFGNARATANARQTSQAAGAPSINVGGITINEANNPEATRRAVQKGLEDAVADASAATARGSR